MQPAAKMQRLFLALWPDDALRERLREHAALWRWSPAARRVAPRDWHATLHFIGPVADDRLDELRVALDVGCEPLQLTLDRPERWPHGLAVLCGQPSAELLALHRRLALALQRLELPVEQRAFRPHLTLARHDPHAQPPLDAPALQWPVSGYALVRSGGDAAARYQTVQRYPVEVE